MDTPAHVPASVLVVFLRADSEVLRDDIHPVEVALTDLALTQYANQLGRPDHQHIIHSTAIANFTGGILDNGAELTPLAEQIATDFYLWRLASLEVRYRAIVPWVADGLHDVEWSHQTDSLITAVSRAVWEPEFGKLLHKGTYSASGDGDDECCGCECPDIDNIAGAEEWTLEDDVDLAQTGANYPADVVDTWTSPPCETLVTFDLTGMGGRSDEAAAGGGGGTIRGTLTVPASTVFDILLSFTESGGLVRVSTDNGVFVESITANKGEDGVSGGASGSGGTTAASGGFTNVVSVNGQDGNGAIGGNSYFPTTAHVLGEGGDGGTAALPEGEDGQSPGGGAGGWYDLDPPAVIANIGGHGRIRITWGPGVQSLNGATGPVSLVSDGPLRFETVGQSVALSINGVREGGESIEIKAADDRWIGFTKGSF